MVRATGNGPTLITDPEGRILASQDYAGSGAILSASVPTHGVTTIYGRFGDWFAYLCVLVVGALTAYAFASGRQPLRVGHFQTA
jgi:apolipoprotein N-acyltransferase